MITEAAAVVPEGRISPQDLGIWSDEHVPRPAAHRRVRREPGRGAGHPARARRAQGVDRAPVGGPGLVDPADGGWQPVGASPIAYDRHSPTPTELTAAELEALPGLFAAAARRALDAGFRWIEIHGAHGYLLHSFLSPLSNARTDAWGGDLDGSREAPARRRARRPRRGWPRTCRSRCGCRRATGPTAAGPTRTPSRSHPS